MHEFVGEFAQGPGEVMQRVYMTACTTDGLGFRVEARLMV
jgi:hypothetical protein